MINEAQMRIFVVLLLSAVLAIAYPSGDAQAQDCGMRLPAGKSLNIEGLTVERPIGFLLAIRCGDRYHTDYLLFEGEELVLHRLEPTVVTPQAEGFWEIEVLELTLPDGCDRGECRHRGIYLFAHRLGEDDSGWKHQALERIRTDVSELLDSAERSNASSEWKDKLLIAAEGLLCLHTTARLVTGGPHPGYIDRDGCVSLSEGRIQLADDALGISEYFSHHVVERTRDRLGELYRSGEFRQYIHQSARSSVGTLEAEQPRLLLDYHKGVITAYAIAEATAPFALSQTYSVEVIAGIGAAPKALVPFNLEADGTARDAFPDAQHVFPAPAGDLAIALDEEGRSLIIFVNQQNLVSIPYIMDDVIVAQWAVGEAALGWERKLTAASD